MLKSKTIDRVCCAALAVMLVLTGVIWAGKASAGRQTAVEVGYEGLFDQSAVHTIDIEMADWDAFIASATQEQYTPCTVTIDGEKIADVGIRGKGNTSLSSVAAMDSQKYSFKIEFDQYVKGRSYRGLDKLSLNNLIYDATMMKDYLAYTLMGKMGVPSPLCSYAQITVNGEPWGLYLAVEGVEDGFMERNNLTTGELYKPDSMGFGGGRGNGRDFDFEQFRVKDEETEEEPAETSETTEAPAAPTQDDQGFGASFGGSGGDSAQDSADGFNPSSGAPSQDGADGFGPSNSNSAQAPEDVTLPENVPSAPSDQSGENRQGGFGGMFNFGMGNSDVKLQYTDDDPDSYANIFDNAKTKVGKKDKARLIAALKTLSGEDAQEAVFTDEVIRYLAVHDFLQNDDSYTGMMVHNYYLYEEKGRLAIIPWDYNLAFGGMGAGGDAKSTVNSPIDSPVSNGSVSDRPLVAWIFEDESALKQYHEAYDRFVTEIIESGWLEGEIARVAEMLHSYVEADANGFYTAEEFDAAVDALQSYCALRGQSIRGQLEGAIPSTSEGQRQNSAALIDAGDLSISAMGAMNTGGGPEGGMPSMPSGSFTPPSGFQTPGGSSDQQQTPENPFGGSGGGPSAGTSTAEAPAETAVPETSSETIATEQPAENTVPASRPDNAPFPPGGPVSSGAQGMSWLTLGLYALVLLLAIMLVKHVPGHAE